MTITDVDPVIADVVQQVTNRFGADGLDQMIRLAAENRSAVDAALRELAESSSR